jgi:hypothetical protein
MQQGIDYDPDRSELVRIASAHGLIIVDVANSPDWSLSMYREGTHPTIQGNRALAGIIAKAIQQSL